MNGKITKAKKQAISADKPDLETMEKFISLLTFGCREEEVIGFGQNYEGANFRYLNLNDFQETLHKQIQWLGDVRSHCPVFSLHPLRPDYQQTPSKQAVGKKHKGTDSTRIRWVVIDIDRTKELKDAGFADGEQIKMLTHAMGELHKELTERHGFKSIPIAFSGHGFHLYLPVEFPNTKETQRTLERFIDLIAPYLGEYSQLELDKQPLLPHTAIRLPGGINRKYEGQHRLTKVINLDDLTPEGCEQARAENSIILEALVVENEPEPEPYNPPKELIAKGLPKGFNATGQASMDDLLKLFDAQQSKETIQSWLEASGYKFLGKRPSGALCFQRPDKEVKGLSLVVGGSGNDNLTYSFSTSDTLIPPGIYFRPYFLKLMLEGVVSNPNGKSHSVLKPEAFKEFFADLRRASNSLLTTNTHEPVQPEPAKVQESLAKEQARHESCEPALVQPLTIAQVQGEEPYKEDEVGTLTDIKLPGFLEELAMVIGRNNMIKAPEIDRAFAIALGSLLIGKSRKGFTGLPLSTYLVTLAPSGSGKDAGRSFLHNYMNQVWELAKSENPTQTIDLPPFSIPSINGLMSGSSQGLSDSLLISGRVLIVGDESECFLHPGRADKEAYQARNWLLTAYKGEYISGRALASGRSRPDIPHPFVSQIHTTQPASYFAAFQDDAGTKGQLGRYIHFRGYWNQANHQQSYSHSIPESLLKEGLYWHKENLAGIERVSLDKFKAKLGENEYVCLGRFNPDFKVLQHSQVFHKRYMDHFQHCRDKAHEFNKSGNFLMEQIYLRISEQALRLASIFTCAESRNALEVNEKLFDLACRIMDRSAQVVAYSGEDKNRVKASKDRERLFMVIQQIAQSKDESKGWLEGDWVRKNKVYKKVDSWIDSNNHFKIILETLVEQGKIEFQAGLQGKANCPDKVRLIANSYKQG
jgi:hypothetical protein